MTPTRERLLHALYEAAELEHDLMCTYLYAAFSLKSGEAEGLSASEADAVARWRRTILVRRCLRDVCATRWSELSLSFKVRSWEFCR